MDPAVFGPSCALRRGAAVVRGVARRPVRRRRRAFRTGGRDVVGRAITVSCPRARSTARSILDRADRRARARGLHGLPPVYRASRPRGSRSPRPSRWRSRATEPGASTGRRGARAGEPLGGAVTGGADRAGHRTSARASWAREPPDAGDDVSDDAGDADDVADDATIDAAPDVARRPAPGDPLRRGVRRHRSAAHCGCGRACAAGLACVGAVCARARRA